MNENGKVALKTAAWDLAFWKFQTICFQTGPPKSADSRQFFVLSIVKVVRVLFDCVVFSSVESILEEVTSDIKDRTLRLMHEIRYHFSFLGYIPAWSYCSCSLQNESFWSYYFCQELSTFRN